MSGMGREGEGPDDGVIGPSEEVHLGGGRGAKWRQTGAGTAALMGSIIFKKHLLVKNKPSCYGPAS